jgi:hypothetical protein
MHNKGVMPSDQKVVVTFLRRSSSKQLSGRHGEAMAPAVHAPDEPGPEDAEAPRAGGNKQLRWGTSIPTAPHS